jgi:F0F1-type ATP synthase assembly protein I
LSFALREQIPNGPMDPNSPRKSIGNVARQVAIAMQIPFSLVVPIFVGGGIGYLLDSWLHTKFVLMIVLGIAGFGIGLREVLQLASAADKKNGG